jgi:hypothetical protein
MSNMLFSITSIVDNLGMGMSLWLALYLLARGFPSRVTIRAVIVLLALFIFFLSASVNLYIQVTGSTAVRAIMLTIVLATWCDLTQKIAPPNTQTKDNWLIPAIYIFAFVTAALLLGTRNVFVQEQTNLLWVGRMKMGFQYTVYAIYLWCVGLSILYNLQSGKKSRVGQVNIYFVTASLLAVSEIAYGSFALALTNPSPRIIQDGLIAGSVIFLGVSVARHQTLVERRTSLYELPIYTLVIFILSGVYAFIAWQWNHSAITVILTTALAVFTHAFFGLVGEVVTQSMYKRESEYRHQLRHLGENLPGGISLQTRLQDGLKLLCDILGATGGFIATRQSDLLVVSVSYESIPPGEKIGPPNLIFDEAYQPSDEFAGAIAWMAPAFKDHEQVALVRSEERRVGKECKA